MRMKWSADMLWLKRKISNRGSGEAVDLYGGISFHLS